MRVKWCVSALAICMSGVAPAATGGYLISYESLTANAGGERLCAAQQACTLRSAGGDHLEALVTGTEIILTTGECRASATANDPGMERTAELCGWRVMVRPYPREIGGRFCPLPEDGTKPACKE